MEGNWIPYFIALSQSSDHSCVPSKETLERHQSAFERIEEALGSGDNFKLPPNYGDKDRQQLLVEGICAGKVTFEDGVDHNCDRFLFINHVGALSNSNPLGLTHLVFLSPLRSQGTDEQVAYWAPLAESGKIIGSYARKLSLFPNSCFCCPICATSLFPTE